MGELVDLGWIGGGRDASLAAAPSVAVIVADAGLRVVHAEGEAFAAHGVGSGQLRGKTLAEVLPQAALRQLEPRYLAALGGTPQSFDYRSQDGTRAYWVQVSPMLDADGGVGSVVAVIQDITERLRTTIDLARSKARLQDAERMIGVGSWELALEDGAITYSDGFARAIGLDPREPLSLESLIERVHPDDQQALTAAMAACVRQGSASGEYRVRRSDGELRSFSVRGEAVADDSGDVAHLRGAVLDVTDQRASERDRFEAMSLFEQGFDASPIGMGLIQPSTGRYLRVNDALCRMLDRTRDELMTLAVSDVTHADDVGAAQEASRAMLEGTLTDYEAEKRYLRADGSEVWAAIHVVPVRSADGSVQALFSQNVDVTERRAREVKLERDIQDALWLGRIRDALDNDRLLLYFQPIVDLRTGEMVQRELLLRMRGEDGSIILPGEFLPVAERYGLVSEIDRWVIRQAVQLASTGVAIEFNLSGASISDPAVLRELASSIKEFGTDPRQLVVEVTETAMMDQFETGRLFAQRVRALGCGLALDDFGTGFGSLTYLKHLPAGHLKIDIEFVRELTGSKTDERLVRGIVGFAREFGQATIAEGIEDEATLGMLRELGVSYGQGHFFGRPRPLNEVPIPNGPCAYPSDTSSTDSIAVVRAAFDAFANRDLDAILPLCDPQVVLRPIATMKLAGRETSYRGHDGIRSYLDDVGGLWDELRVTPTMFWEADGATVAFGQAFGRHDNHTETSDVLWVSRFRNGLIASLDVFRSASAEDRPRVMSAGARSAGPGRD